MGASCPWNLWILALYLAKERISLLALEPHFDHIC